MRTGLHMAMAYGLGIDTGGTYTDSVVIDMETGRISRRSKALTTRDNLADGITESLRGLGPLEGISLVSLSTTLATNSIVEGKSCRVGLISLGRRFGHTVRAAQYAYLDAQIDLKGKVAKRLSQSEARAAVESMRGRIDVLAVAGYMSVRNPVHEDAVRSMAERMLGIPVVCAHDLTSKLGFERRTNTAVLNAGLIPTVIELISSVRYSLDRLGVDAPMMIVKGDGSVMNVATAMRRPIETVMSGPASSLTGAMAYSGAKDALIVDIGGTTTDLGIVRGGFVRTLDSGATVGGHRTRVRAADVSTYGIGGDSRIYLENGRIALSPVRVIPMCIASSRWKHVRERLSSAAANGDGDIELYIPASNARRRSLSGHDLEFIGNISEGPLSVSEVSAQTGIPAERFGLKELESTGCITGIGLTPTDLLAAEGTYREYDPEASRIAASILASQAGMDPGAFISAAKEMVVGRICGCIADHLARTEEAEGGLSDPKTIVRLGMPMIGIGAPAGAWLPKAAEHFSAELILPDDYDVRNAIGAISSSVAETAEVLVRAAFQDFSENPECIVYNGTDAFDFQCKDDAMEFARAEAARIASARAMEAGAQDVVLEYRVEETCVNMKGDGSKVFRGATVLARASGRPVMHWFD